MSDFLTDIKTQRKRAREHMEQGALTMEEEHADALVNLLKVLGA